MVSGFHWKLIIAGSVGGACAFFSSVLVFAILVCRHKRKLKRRASKRAHHRRASTQHSHSTDPSELTRGFNGAIGSADLPLPIPPDANYVQPAFGVGPFWMGQNSINHDSGCADLESNRTDSASYGQSSFSPLPRTLNGHAARTFPGDTFPAMSSFDIDSDLSHSFDLLSPPVLNFGFGQNGVRASAKPSNQRAAGPSSGASPGDHVWKPNRCCSSSNNIETSYLESRPHDSSLQLVELAHPNGYSRSRCPSGQASMLSSSDDDDPIWIRRTSVQPDSTLTQTMVNHSNSDPSSVWLLSGERSFAAAVPATRDPIARPAVTSSRAKTAFGGDTCQRNAFSNPSRNDVRKQNGFMNPQEAYGCVYRDFNRGGTMSN